MNILFITNNSPFSTQKHGGAETSLRLLAEKLAEKGNNVHYLSHNHKSSVVNRVVLHRYPGYINYIPFKRFFPFDYGIRIKNRIIKFYIKKIIRQHNIDIVNVFYDLNTLLCVLEARNKYKFKIVMRMAGLHWYEQCLKNNFLIKKYEYAFSQIDSVNFIHDSLVYLVDQKFKELKMSPSFKRLFVCDIGTSSPIGRSRPYITPGKSTFKIIMVSRFSDYQKRHDILIHAVKLASSHIPINLHLIGEGVTKPIYEKLCVDLGIDKLVAFSPFMPRDLLWEHMLNAHLLCHSCNYEGLGKIIIESMALGLPVMASNVSPINNYIVNSETGILVDNDPNLWAKNLIKLYQEQNILSFISKNSCSYIDQVQNPDINIDYYLKEYREIM